VAESRAALSRLGDSLVPFQNNIMNRTEMLQRLRSEAEWDVVIIGGGATGLGVAVDSATRGYRTLLVEAHDFAKATSSRSTKLVHGGVRYLEQGDIPLVLEALRERGLLHRNAPQLVHHLSFIVPRYKWWEGPFFGIGLKMYDFLAGKLNLEKSRLLSRDETLARIPNIEPENLLGGVEYFDGQFDDARLAVTLAQTAADHGACMLNYVRATNLVKRDGLVCGVNLEDVETGEAFEVRAHVVVNATGIFADTIRAMDEPDGPVVVQPSQGVHLVFDREFLQGDSAIMVPHTDDGRVLFVIPWHGKVLVGTTDTPMDKAELEPRALDEEIGFILRNASRYLSRDPQRSDVLSIFAGQRPLVRPPRSDGSSTKQISRNHEVLISDGGLVTVVGGKWTTYRKMAEDAMTHAALIGELPERKCVTETLQLHGWASPHKSVSDDARGTYGSDEQHIQRLIQEEPDLGTPIAAGVTYQAAHVVWAVRNEMARSIEDVLSRRTRVLFLDAQAALDAAPRVAELLARELGRDQQWIDAQLAEFRELAGGYLP
jgi:glycerol-3-phosphate dehydrogenase